MPITNTNAADNAARLTKITGTANNGNDIGSKNVFLKLLVAQMRNQDPLKPQDPTQMSAQLARFNMVEQQLSTNKLLQQIADASTTSDPQSATAASYLGHQAVINSDTISFDGTSSNDLVIHADAATQTSNVSIVDANGKVVNTLHTGKLNAGDTTFTWDGTTTDGSQAAAGNYTIQVKAADLSGKDVNTSTQIAGLVQAVRITSNGTNLVVAGVSVPIETIKEIRL